MFGIATNYQVSHLLPGEQIAGYVLKTHTQARWMQGISFALAHLKAQANPETEYLKPFVVREGVWTICEE